MNFEQISQVAADTNDPAESEIATMALFFILC